MPGRDGKKEWMDCRKVKGHIKASVGRIKKKEEG
jgi:hypothetical protein